MAIEIYNVVLHPEIIVGVGPLVKVVNADREFRLQFDLYCVNYRTVITTDLLSFEGTGKDESNKQVAHIREAWELLRHNFANNLPMETGFPVLPKSMPGV